VLLVVRRRLFLFALAILGARTCATAAAADEPLQGQEWFLAAVGADPAAAPGPGVPLTFVDSGLDASQPDFAGRPGTTYLDAQTVIGTNESHGTEIASIAPANGIGIVGVYPQAALAAWDATPAPSAAGIDSSLAAAGIAAAPCPGVVNLSWGASVLNGALQQAILAAQRRGCLLVAAAGNLAGKGNPTVYPPADLHVLAVGASDQTDARASFSSFGPWVDLLTPVKGFKIAFTLRRGGIRG
jgi:hypothetical protein